MIELQNYRMPRDVDTLLQLRGSSIPPLLFHDCANRAAKATLDRMEPTDLLGKRTPASADMAVMVKALLYLWNGWPAEAMTLLENAPLDDREYVFGMCRRQLGDVEEAKAAFQQLERHGVFEPLAAFAIETFGQVTDTHVRRLHQLLEMVQEWEPFAFIDLFEQCRAGVVTEDGSKLVCAVQCREFELLFAHCLEAALGQPLPLRKSEKEEAAAARERLRERQREKKNAPTRRRDAPAEQPAATATAPPPSSTLKVRCPKCGKTVNVTADRRGQSARCDACSSQFLVPRGGGIAATMPPPGTAIGVRCPKCQHTAMLSPVARGKSHTCAKCAARFLVPKSS